MALDLFFLPEAVLFFLFSSSAAVGTEQRWLPPQVTARACSQLSSGQGTLEKPRLPPDPP